MAVVAEKNEHDFIESLSFPSTILRYIMQLFTFFSINFSSVSIHYRAEESNAIAEHQSPSSSTPHGSFYVHRYLFFRIHMQFRSLSCTPSSHAILVLENLTAGGGEAVLEQLLGLVGPFAESFCEIC
jgi:hypothetical protein